jgi:hypothetical protein
MVDQLHFEIKINALPVFRDVLPQRGWEKERTFRSGGDQDAGRLPFGSVSEQQDGVKVALAHGNTLKKWLTEKPPRAVDPSTPREILFSFSQYLFKVVA